MEPWLLTGKNPIVAPRIGGIALVVAIGSAIGDEDAFDEPQMAIASEDYGQAGGPYDIGTGC